MSEPLISANKLCVGYPSIDVLDNVDLSLDQGETFGLIGLNGSGKTTLLKTILGLRQKKAGQFDLNLSNDSEVKHLPYLAYLPEKFEPSPFLTGLEFIKFSLDLYNIKKDDDEICLAAHDLAFETNFIRKKVSSYSKGMRQKIGILATILSECKLMILDEPMSGLDPFSRTLVKDLILSKKEEGITFLISSHVLADMEEICDNIGIIDQGKLRFSGRPHDFVKQTGGENLERCFMELVLHNR